jgi:hypothetical protein
MRLGTMLVMGFLAVSAGCGSSGSAQSDSDASTTGPCAAGEVYCPTCGGRGFCNASCPAIVCPEPSDASGGADASGGDGGGCPADASSTCLDCSGGRFCVSGPCPAFSCSDVDAAAPPCPATLPAAKEACTEPQACPYGPTCAFCAPTNPGIGPLQCSTKSCTWGSLQLQSNPSPCTPSPPTQGDSCGSSVTCYYCTPGSLVVASCSSINDTYTWSVGPVANMASD